MTEPEAEYVIAGGGAAVLKVQACPSCGLEYGEEVRHCDGRVYLRAGHLLLPYLTGVCLNCGRVLRWGRRERQDSGW
jgi:hypothetical protein